MEARNLDLHFAREVTRTLRAWDDLDRPHGIEVIDFRLAPHDWRFPDNPFRHRRDVLKHLQELTTSFPRDTLDGQLVGAKIDSSITFLELLKNPKKVGYEEGMKYMLGIQPFLIPYPELSFQFGLVSKRFNNLYGENFTRQGWLNFISRNQITPEEAAKQAQESEKEISNSLISVSGIQTQPRTTVKIANRSDYWMAWTKGERIGNSKQVEVEMRINRNRLTAGRWFSGKSTVLTYHELEHGIQAQGIVEADQIQLDTTVPGPEQWISEAWASEITRIFPQVLRGYTEVERAAVEFAVELGYLTDMSNYWGQYRRLALGDPKENIIRDLLELQPHEKPDRVRFVHDAYTETASRMFYLPSYGDGSYFLRNHVEPLPDDVKRKLAREFHSRLWLPDQFKAIIISKRSSGDANGRLHTNGDAASK